MVLTCPNCQNQDHAMIMGAEYIIGHPEHYDGVSEWRCRVCGTRWGRWSGRVLVGNDCEKKVARLKYGQAN